MGKLILVTGGAGFIGSHTVVELLLAGHECVVIDNLKNANLECIKRQERITGKKITYYQVDILDRSALDDVFSKHAFFAVIHFAGLKSVGESCTKPLEYYRTNVGGTITLLECMREHGVKNMVFSSSSTVYGLPQYLPLDEKHPIGGCPNPYGNTKLVVELMLKDLVCARPDWNVVCLRYFNPVGAHPSGLIGEDPLDVPNNLMPYISQVAVGRRPVLSIFGSDYNTKDGTGVRDYIHIVDLAIGHVAALKKLEENCGHKVYNLGTGMGLSVLDLVHAMEKASGKKIPYKLVDRRPGDIETNYADATLAFVEMGWKTERGVAEMCEDAWRFQNSNPFGYALSQASVKKIDGCEVSTRCQNGCMAHEEN